MSLLDKLYDDYRIPSNGLREGQQKTKCPQCQPQHDPRDNPLSVEVGYDKILFHCHHCGWNGGVVENKNQNFRAPVKPKPEPVSYIPATSKFLEDFFNSRGISKNTYEAFNVFSEDSTWIGFPYNGYDKKCDNIKYRSKDKKFRQTKNPKKSLYNYGNVRDAEEVIFVEGEMDCLAVAEAGFLNVTTLPDGAPAEAKYKEGDKRFEPLKTHPLKADKIILFVDNDDAGKNLRAELLHRFGKDKCWRVRLPDGCKDANEVLLKHGALKLSQLIKSAPAYPVDGLYNAYAYANDVFDLYEGNFDKPVEIGYESLDRIYKIMRGTFHVWTGIPNHGKSSFLDQCLIELAKKHKWKFALFSPEHSTKMHIRRLAMMYSGKSFDPNINGRMTQDDLTLAMNFINDHFYFIETKDHTPNIQRILETARGAIKKFGCDCLIIDPYNEVDASRRGSQREDEHIKNFISECKRFSKLLDVTTFVVAHPTKMPKQESGGYAPPTAYDISGAAHWSNQADAVITIHRDFESDTMRVITRKIREQGLYGQIGEAVFWYNSKRYRFEDAASV